MTDYRVRIAAKIQAILSGREDAPPAVKALQDYIWETVDVSSPSIADERLRELAHDLDFFQPDSAKRLGEPSLYGQNELIPHLEAALADLTALS
ncbi:MAG: hypothetical protein V4466_03050 [Pseudomonadota bacterium]